MAPTCKGQADSRQGITTGLAGGTGHWSCYILWYVELKKAWIDVIWPFQFSWIRGSRHFVASHHLHPPPLCDCLWYWLPCKINYLKWWAFQLAIHWRVHPLNGLGLLQISGEMHTSCSVHSWDTMNLIFQNGISKYL